MLLSAKRLLGRNVRGADDSIGLLRDVFFTEKSGNVRYLAVEAGDWLEGREILLAPQSLENARPDVYELRTRLSRHMVEHSPPVTADLPISRAYEVRLHKHYGWARYWGASSEDAATSATVVLETPGVEVDPDLRSVKDALGHRLHASDGEIGHLDDLLIDPLHWEIAYAVAKTRNWLPGRTVVIPRGAILQVRWDARAVTVELTREQIRAAPEYVDKLLTDETYLSEISALYQHFETAGIGGGRASEGDRQGAPDFNREGRSVRNEPEVS